MRVLVVEDEEAIQRDLERTLTANGFAVQTTASGDEAWFLGDTETFEAAILDLGLPDLDGLSVLRRWRENGRQMPVIILSARGTWRERVEGIDAGADDYLAKPFSMEELLARLNAIIRRQFGQSSPLIQVEGIDINTRTQRVTVSSVPVDLTPLEFRMLVFLAMHRGRAVSQVELTEHLYAQDFERGTNAIEALVGRLRRKLGVDGLILTRRGYGYEIPADSVSESPPAERRTVEP